MSEKEKILKDRYGRVHDYLRISITDKCNLRCSYCIPFDLPAGFYSNSVRMSVEEIDKIVAEFVSLGVKKIRITGGEPLIRKEAHNIIETIARHPVELAITSNGVLIDEFIDTFRKAGIRSVNLSLDTLQREKFTEITKRDNFNKVLSNIRLLLSVNFNVKINVVVMKGVNDNEIIDFVELTKDQPLHVRFIEFMPFDGNKWEQAKVIPHSEILRIIAARFEYIKLPDEKNSTVKAYQVSGYKGSFGHISTLSEPFCGDCNRLRLTSDGKLKNCLFSSEEIDLLTPLREGKDILKLIFSSVSSKKEKHGGQLHPGVPDFDSNKIINRCMVGIGG